MLNASDGGGRRGLIVRRNRLLKSVEECRSVRHVFDTTRHETEHSGECRCFIGSSIFIILYITRKNWNANDHLAIHLPTFLVVTYTYMDRIGHNSRIN